MQLVHGQNAMVADEPEDFAGAIVELHENARLWQDISREGFNNVREMFSFDRAEKALRKSLMNPAGK